jgi:cytochrome c-type biogenesis protein CcmH/NrfF
LSDVELGFTTTTPRMALLLAVFWSFKLLLLLFLAKQLLGRKRKKIQRRNEKLPFTRTL